MQITIEEATYYAVTDCRILAIQGEANTRSVHFTYPAVSGAEQYFLRVQLRFCNDRARGILGNPLNRNNASVSGHRCRKNDGILRDGQVIDEGFRQLYP